MDILFNKYMIQNPVFFVYNVIMLSIIYAVVLSRRHKLTPREKAKDSRVVWLGVKLREEPLKIWTRYKE